MSKTLTPKLVALDNNVTGVLEEARKAHEKYLIRQLESDLEKAIECYIDVIKIFNYLIKYN